MKNDLLLIAIQEMDTEIKAKRREWEKQGGRENQIDIKASEDSVPLGRNSEKPKVFNFQTTN